MSQRISADGDDGELFRDAEREEKQLEEASQECRELLQSGWVARRRSQYPLPL